MSPQPLSVQLYTVRDAIAADLDDALRRVRDVGFRHVELYGFVERADEYAQSLERHGLSVSSAHARLISGDADAIFAAARTVEVPTLIDPGERHGWDSLDTVRRYAETLNERAVAAAELGLRVGYHNHWWEIAELGGTPALEVFADLLSPEVVLEVDTYWTAVGGADAVATLRRFGDRVQFIHVKDGPIREDDISQVAVGSGSMPVLEILAAAPQAVPIVELDGFDGDVFDALRDSFAFLTANGVPA